jgi:restriction endonuclease S subunit
MYIFNVVGAKYIMETKKTKVGNLIQITAGPNLSRLRFGFDEKSIYTSQNIEEDLSQVDSKSSFVKKSPSEFSTNIGDLILGMIICKAAVVSPKNSGLLINSNFAKCMFDAVKLDPWFFCYWLNESEEIAVQTHMINLRGILTPNTVENLEISLPDIFIQRELGTIYRKRKRFEFLLNTEKDEINKLTKQLIKNKMKGNH